MSTFDELVLVPEAHLPADRHLLVDDAGLVLATSASSSEDGEGRRQTLRWADCFAGRLWPDRLELVFDPRDTVTVRADEWFGGTEALRVIVGRVPATVAIALVDDPPADYSDCDCGCDLDEVDGFEEPAPAGSLPAGSPVLRGLAGFRTWRLVFLIIWVSLQVAHNLRSTGFLPLAVGSAALAASFGWALVKRLRVPGPERAEATRRGRVEGGSVRRALRRGRARWARLGSEDG